MKFPIIKTKVLVLAHDVNTGLKSNTDKLPSPPLKTDTMDGYLTEYENKRAEIVAAEAVLKQLYEEEAEIFENIESGTKQNIGYTESVAKGNAAILALISWGVPAARQPLLPPGQPRVLEIIGQGDAWVQVDWKEPVDGGKVASYVVRRSADGEDFVDAKTETASESILLNQPTGKKLVYQVVAINKAGESLASNTVSLVL